MKRKMLAGTTSVSLGVFVQDTSSTTGTGLAITHASSGLVFEYRRQGQSSWTSVTPVTATLGTFTSGGVIADGALTGAIEIGVPDAALAAGARFCLIRLRGVTNMLPVLIEMELDAVDYQNATSLGLSRLDGTITSRMASYTQPTGFLAATFPTTVASTTNITAATGVTLAATTGLGNQTADITGTVSTVTNLTNLPSIPANWLTAAGIASGAFTSAKFAAGAFDAVWTVATRTLTAISDSSGVTTLLTRIVGTLASGTHNAQSGDSFARLGAPAGASISADVAALLSTTEDVNATVNSIATNALTQANIRTAVGLASANLDTQLSAIDDFLDTEIAAMKVATDRFLTMIVLDGAVYQFTENAVELAPAGGGGGGTDWTANERTAIRAILGVPTSGTTPETPTTGVLDAILDKALLITSTNVTSSNPVTSTGQITSPVFIGDDYLHANGRAFSWTIAARSGVTAATATCFFGGSYGTSTWLVQGTFVDNGISTWTLRFDLPKTITGSLVAGFYAWSVELRNAAGTEITEVASGRNVDVRVKQT
jgi:hypothetical protein